MKAIGCDGVTPRVHWTPNTARSKFMFLCESTWTTMATCISVTPQMQSGNYLVFILELVEQLYNLDVVLPTSYHCCRLTSFIHGIHIGTTHVMQGLLDNINVLLQRNIHTNHHDNLYQHQHTHCNNNAKPFIPHNRIHNIHLCLCMIFRPTLATTPTCHCTLQSHNTRLHIT